MELYELYVNLAKAPNVCGSLTNVKVSLTDADFFIELSKSFMVGVQRFCEEYCYSNV